MLIGLKSAVRGILLPLSVFIMYRIAIETGAGQQTEDHVALTCWLSPALCSTALCLILRSPKLAGVACKETCINKIVVNL